LTQDPKPLPFGRGLIVPESRPGRGLFPDGP